MLRLNIFHTNQYEMTLTLHSQETKSSITVVPIVQQPVFELVLGHDINQDW